MAVNLVITTLGPIYNSICVFYDKNQAKNDKKINSIEIYLTAMNARKMRKVRNFDLVNILL